MADSNEEVQARWGLKNEKEVPWDREKGLDADSAEQYRAAILEFISFKSAFANVENSGDSFSLPKRLASIAPLIAFLMPLLVKSEVLVIPT